MSDREFSEADLERVVDVLVMSKMGDNNMPLSEFHKAAHAVIAALKGDRE